MSQGQLDNKRKSISLQIKRIQVRLLEDDPAFDAGRGSVLTNEGQVILYYFSFHQPYLCKLFHRVLANAGHLTGEQLNLKKVNNCVSQMLASISCYCLAG